ncbi:MAG: fused MFS/spermidine synthase [Desulfomonile tiedjei]|uniref:Fused MFS/spermidine synthase n=1 Tax=Desulfomonile tiedjei TaxID=2358 RepID=A0A9D6V4D7_9BACT|nr:fused MFS/spermidine synthase [Desulfomonile tiedjei]
MDILNTEQDHRAATPNVHYYFLTVAFFSGMAVMGVEICASRLMAPFFGTSLTIWTVIIGATMIALTGGYYLGGILAEKRPRMSVLGTLLFVASLFMIFLPYIAQPVMEVTLGRFVRETTGSQSNNAIIVSLTICALLISVPVVVLGMTSPFLIHLDSLRSGSVGRTSGKIFAFSTLGSILGTFLPALVLIPLIGTRLSFLLFGGLLLCVTMWSIERQRLMVLVISITALAMAFLMGIQGWGTGRNRYLVQEKETNYQLVRIFRSPIQSENANNTKYSTILLTDAGLGLQSMWVEGQSYTDSWQDFFAVVPRVYEKCATGTSPKNLLLLGLGGACAPYLISQLYPDTLIDGVEIDGALIDAARPYFPFSSTKNLNIHISDARFFLRSTSKEYDVIVIDTFRPPLIPFHLATVEFFEQVKQHLTQKGIMAMNIGSTGEKEVFTGIANTIAGVFPNVYFARYFSPQEHESLFTSQFIVASVDDLSLDKPESEDRIFSVPNPEWREVFETMRDPSGFDVLQYSYFRRIRFDPQIPFFTDDISSLDTIAEREFLGLILGRGM